jgi:hypothetical protein
MRWAIRAKLLGALVIGCAVSACIDGGTLAVDSVPGSGGNGGTTDSGSFGGSGGDGDATVVGGSAGSGGSAGTGANQGCSEGDLTGESTLEYLMVYTSDREASFVGLERFEGTLAGKKGTFVLQRKGTAGADGVVREEFFIVPGSGTGDLGSVTGKGNWDSGHADSYPFSFEYEL